MKKEIWNIEETRELVISRFGEDQLELAKPCLQSVNDRLTFSKFHYIEINSLFSAFKSSHLGEGETIIGLSESAEKEYFQMMLKIGAHAVACLQSLHSVGDILANAIYFSIGMNLSLHPLKDREISIYSVQKKLKGIPEFNEITTEVDLLLESNEYLYLAAAANSSKHRNLVPPNITEDWTGTKLKLHEITFEPFIHAGKSYMRCPIGEPLKPVFEKFSKLIVNSGNTINSYLIKI